MSIVLLIIRTIGLPATVVIVLLAYYEGVPFLREFPFIEHVPVVRELVTGRVQSERVKAADEARQGYVLLAEKTAAEVKAAEMERQRNAAGQALEEHRRQLDTARKKEAETAATLEQEIVGYELLLSQKNRQCLLDSSDVDWMQRH